MMEKITGYHGTNKHNIESIKSRGFRIKTFTFMRANLEKVPGDLGSGLYAYAGQLENAELFAKKENRPEEIAVLKLEIEVDPEKVLDMDEEDNQELIQQVFNSRVISDLSNRYKASQGGKSRDCLDGLIIEHIIHKASLKVDLVKKKTYTPFPNKPRLSHFHNGLELCIKNKSIIRDVDQVI